MRAFSGFGADAAGARRCLAGEGVEQGTLPYPAVSGQDCEVAGEEVAEFVYSRVGGGGAADHGDSGFAIGFGGTRVGIEVDFRDTEDGLNASACGGNEVAIDEAGAERRIGGSGDDDQGIDVGGDDAFATGIDRVGAREGGAAGGDGGDFFVADGDAVAGGYGEVGVDEALFGSTIHGDGADAGADADDERVGFGEVGGLGPFCFFGFSGADFVGALVAFHGAEVVHAGLFLSAHFGFALLNGWKQRHVEWTVPGKMRWRR